MNKQYTGVALAVLMSCGSSAAYAENNPFGALFGIPQQQPQPAADQAQAQAAGTSQNRNVRYAGYSEKFQPVKKLMREGNATEASKQYVKRCVGGADTSAAEGLSDGGKSGGDDTGLGSLFSSFSGDSNNTASFDDEDSDSQVASNELSAEEDTGNQAAEGGGGFGSLFSSFTGESDEQPATEATIEADTGTVSTEKATANIATSGSAETGVQAEASPANAVANPDTPLIPQNASLLGSLEQGVLAIDAGNHESAVEHFSVAETFVEQQKKSSETADTVGGISDFFGSVLTGDGEIGAYGGEGFERVLMLNYKSIAFMLNGDRRAYNVTRRSIDWQNLEKRKFDERLNAARKEMVKQTSEEGSSLGDTDVGSSVAEQYKETEAKALTVPSAYVNPFGYYMAGVVQEFDSYEDRSLRGNARIAYEKALKLNPDSKVIKSAVKDLKKKRPPKNKRLVHIVLGDGFVPEKKMLRYDLFAIQYNIPIKLPIYEPVPSTVAYVEVQDHKGKRLSKFSPVADVEAIALRHQKDSEPFQNLLVTATVLRTIVEKEALKQVPFGLGQVVGSIRDEMGNPDMRSWMTLPSSLQAVRMYVPKKQKTLQLVSFDADGKELARRKIELDTSSHNFVYARTIDNAMYVTDSKKLWVAMK